MKQERASQRGVMICFLILLYLLTLCTKSFICLAKRVMGCRDWLASYRPECPTNWPDSGEINASALLPINALAHEECPVTTLILNYDTSYLSHSACNNVCQHLDDKDKWYSPYNIGVEYESEPTLALLHSVGIRKATTLDWITPQSNPPLDTGNNNWNGIAMKAYKAAEYSKEQESNQSCIHTERATYWLNATFQCVSHSTSQCIISWPDRYRIFR
jgi:hypothetical protein